MHVCHCSQEGLKGKLAAIVEYRYLNIKLKDQIYSLVSYSQTKPEHSSLEPLSLFW